MSRTRLRVIIPNYKHEDCVNEALDSVKNQDCNATIVGDYPRLGKGFRMNLVVRKIEEEFLNVHDADDISVKNRFEICSQYFDDFDVIYHDIWIRQGLWNNRWWQRVGGQPEILSSFSSDDYVVHKSREWDRELYKTVSYVPASSIIVRTEIAKKVQWQTNTYCQDWIWLNLIAEHTDRFKYIPEPLLYYRGEKGFTRDLKFKRVRRFFIKRQIARLTR